MSEPDPLTTIDALVQMSFLVQGTLERHASEQGVSLIQTRLLGVLRDRQPTINELSGLLGLDKSSVSGLVDRAERRGLVTRRRSERDRRSVIVVLSDVGRGMVGEVAQRLEADLLETLRPLDAGEIRLLTELLSRVLFAEAGRRVRPG